MNIIITYLSLILILDAEFMLLDSAIVNIRLPIITSEYCGNVLKIVNEFEHHTNVQITQRKNVLLLARLKPNSFCQV